MFVPVPKENFYIYVKNGEEEWRDIFGEINAKHQNNRLGGHEAIVFAMGNGLRYYAASVNSVSAIEKDDKTNVNFLVLRKVIVGYLKHKYRGVSKNIEIIIRIQDMGNRSDHSHYYKLRN